MITAYLASGHDVVLPQMLLDPAEVERFEACAAEAGGSFVERFLMDDVEHAVARFGRRGEADPGNPWHGQVQGIVAANGGDLELVRCHAALLDLFGQRSSAVAVPSVDGAVEDTYQRLICSLT